MLQEITKEGNALLMAIRNSESSKGDKAYNMRYSPKGGATFTSFDKHPNIRESVPWRTDGKKSDAAGAYQFLSSTWKPIASKYGLSDFSPANQDKGAWILAQRDFKAKTGKDLQETLETGQVDKVFKALSSTWTSLPSGAEKNKLTGKAYQTYEESLKTGNLVTGATILANPLGYLTGRLREINPSNPLAQPISEAIEDGSFFPSPEKIGVRIAIGALGAIFLILGFNKLKI